MLSKLLLKCKPVLKFYIRINRDTAIGFFSGDEELLLTSNPDFDG